MRFIMRKKIQNPNTIFLKHPNNVLYDLQNTEKEFGLLLSSHWEFLQENPTLQRKLIHGAKRLQEVRFILASQKFIRTSVQ